MVIRHFSDENSFVLKPPQMEGHFRAILSKQQVLNLTSKMGKRDLAAVLLNYHPAPAAEAAVVEDWSQALTQQGYQRLVFLRAYHGSRLNGLPIVREVRASSLALPPTAQPTRNAGN